MQLRLAMDLDAEGRPRHEDPVLLDEMVRVALVDAPGATHKGWLRSGFSRSSSPLRRLILPAACLLLGGGVATGMWSVRNESLRGPTIEEMPRVREAARPRVRNAARVTAPRLAPLSPDEEADLRPREPAPPVVVPTPVPPAPKARPRAGHRQVAVAAPAAPSPGQMFASANQARRSGDYAAALAEYNDLFRRYPGTREELTGRIIVAELALARRNPAEALRQFDSYLASSPSGTLAEEARVGRASALAALSRPDDERAAWQDVLRRHPASVHAQRARDRLNQLR